MCSETPSRTPAGNRCVQMLVALQVEPDESLVVTDVFQAGICSHRMAKEASLGRNIQQFRIRHPRRRGGLAKQICVFPLFDFPPPWQTQMSRSTFTLGFGRKAEEFPQTGRSASTADVIQLFSESSSATFFPRTCAGSVRLDFASPPWQGCTSP